ncbi:MAG: DNA polymerase III subunit chi [Gammaproteobacteria bacterium]|nr:DNA polymerase III subunit chi [Gammaproteobacteria bacterium]
MTQIDFYIVDEDATHSREQLLCRLVDKIWQQDRQIHIHTESSRHSAVVDELLWTYQAGSFIPHAVYQQGLATPAPVLVGHQDDPAYHSDVLINMAPQVPLFFSRFERVLELVNSVPEIRQHGRERYRFYTDRGYSIKTHNLGAQTAGAVR